MMSLSTVDLRTPPGVSLLEGVRLALLEAGHSPALLDRVCICVNGNLIPVEQWHTRLIEPGDYISLHVPVRDGGGGGGGKNVLGTIGMAVVAIVAMVVTWGAATGAVAAGWGAAAAGATSFSVMGVGGLSLAGAAFATVAGMATMTLGMMAVNALAPPTMPKMNAGSFNSDGVQQGERIWSITGTRNSMELYGKIPLVLGKVRFAPRIGAKPHTFLSGNDQYARFLYVVMGRNKVSDLRLGDTSLDQYAAQRVVVHEEWQGEPFEFFADQIHEEDVSLELKNSSGWQTRTTKMGTTEVSLQFDFPQGMMSINNKKGKRYQETVQIAVEYSPVGKNAWRAAGPVFSITMQTMTPQRRGYVFRPEGDPDKQYDVRTRRLTPDGDNSGNMTYLTASSWALIRSVVPGTPIVYQNRPLTVIELEIKATEQLSGNLDDFNCLFESYAPVWREGEWREEPTNLPSSLALLLATSNVVKRPTTMDAMDLDTYKNFQAWCETHGWAFNQVITDGDLVQGVLHSVLSAARASYTHRNGLHSVVWDDPDAPTVFLYGPRNSWGFKGSKMFYKVAPQALRMRFLNEQKSYQEDERVVYADGYDADNATEIIEWEQDGVTSPDLIYKHGRLRLADLVLRPESYEFQTDFSFLCVERGDRIRCVHDVTMWGLAQARVMEVIPETPEEPAAEPTRATGIVIDEYVTMQEGKQYAIRVCTADNAYTHFSILTTPGDSTRELRFMTPIPLSQAPRFDDLLAFGIAERETADLKVLSVEPGDNLTAVISCQDAAPGVYEAIDGPIPPWDSMITEDSPYKRGAPNVPEALEIVTDERALLSVAGVGLLPRIMVFYRVPEKRDVVVAGIDARIRVAGSGGGWTRADVPYVDAAVFYINGVDELEMYEFQMRALSSLGVASEFSPAYAVKIIGRTTPPPAPARVMIENTKIWWEMPEYVPPDVIGWQVYMSFDADDSFNMGKMVSKGTLPTREFDLAPWWGWARRAWVVTVDELGLTSEPVSVLINAGDVVVNNVVYTVSERERHWPGRISNGKLADGCISAESRYPFWNEKEAFWS